MTDQLPFVQIDGSEGEGGGQILRSSLALAASLGRPFRIARIRAQRPKPGLMRQHLTAVEAAAAICNAQVRGASVGSSDLEFIPGTLRGGAFRFSIGTAGSTTLVMQAILPALMFAPEPSEVIIEGGTHARWAPPYDFFERALLPALRAMGPRLEPTLERYGFYPAGGGRLRVNVAPAPPVALRLETRPEITTRRVRVLIAKIPHDIALREIGVLRQRLGWEITNSDITAVADSVGPGNAVSVDVGFGAFAEVFSEIGDIGKPAEGVARAAADAALAYIASGVPVGPHLADQLMTPMAIAASRGSGECSFVTGPLTRHAQTNTDVIAKFVGAVPRVERDGERVRWSVG
jgi:RNA 3'-terminal phosphate cyclase (ATP)